MYPEFRKTYLEYVNGFLNKLDVIYNDTSISDSVKRERFAEVGKEHDTDLSNLL